MSYFSSNIKLLRLRRQRTQDVVSGELGFSRSTLNSYENGAVKNPTLDALMLFSKYYRTSIDTLVKVDLTKLGESQLSELEKGNDVYITGSRLRILATTVDSNKKENIELVNQKAWAGYKNGYADPEFIQHLPAFQLPILLNDRKYRMFQISGDSMLPIMDKSWIIAEYLENWYEIKDGHAYIVLTVEDGIVFKLVNNHLKKRILELISLNSEYQPYQVHVNEVKEVWKFCNYIADSIPDTMAQKSMFLTKINKIEEEIGDMKTALEIKSVS